MATSESLQKIKKKILRKLVEGSKKILLKIAGREDLEALPDSEMTEMMPH